MSPWGTGHGAEVINKALQAWKGMSGLRKDGLFPSPSFMDQPSSRALCHVAHICCHGQPDVRYCKPIQPCGLSLPTTLFLLLFQPDFVANDINSNDKGDGGGLLCFSLWACQARQMWCLPDFLSVPKICVVTAGLGEEGRHTVGMESGNGTARDSKRRPAAAATSEPTALLPRSHGPLTILPTAALPIATYS